MINATVSHEMRNPLNAIIGQIFNMKDLLRKLGTIVIKLRQKDGLSPSEVDKLASSIQDIRVEMKGSVVKIESGAKFIDFFVHDILDFSVLNNSNKNFTKDEKVFDIREAVAEIVEMQKDKMNMMQI